MRNTTSEDLQEIIADLHMRIALQEMLLGQVVMRLAAMQKRPDDLLAPVMDDMALALRMAVETADDDEEKTEALRAAACFGAFEERLRATMAAEPAEDLVAAH